MSINVKAWYTQFIARERLADTATLKAAFLDAANSAVLTLNNRAFQSLDEVESVDTDNIDLGVSYKPILNEMLKYFLQESGQWTKDPDTRAEEKFEKAIRDAKSLWWGDTPPWAGAHGGALSDD